MKDKLNGYRKLGSEKEREPCVTKLANINSVLV